jgi:hypothetical protein
MLVKMAAPATNAMGMLELAALTDCSEAIPETLAGELVAEAATLFCEALAEEELLEEAAEEAADEEAAAGVVEAAAAGVLAAALPELPVEPPELAPGPL